MLYSNCTEATLAQNDIAAYILILFDARLQVDS